MPYKHITKEERVKIEAWIEAGETNSKMASWLGRSRSSVGDEINRNGGRKKYKAKEAEKRRVAIRKNQNATLRKIVPGNNIAQTIEEGMKQYWSPEQIVGRARQEHPSEGFVCHETIYRFLYLERPEFMKFLRCRKGKYRRRYGTKIRENRRELAKKKRIDLRPKIVETRKRLGDWEGDTIVGKEKTKHILTHVDRKSGFLIADKLERATAEAVRKVTTTRFRRLPKKKRHTITYDNGRQFENHEVTARDISVDIFFAYPYHSWERGTNENTNGLLRQFFPKGSPFKNITQQKIDRVAKLINTRPRKRLGYRTPLEVFNGV